MSGAAPTIIIQEPLDLTSSVSITLLTMEGDGPAALEARVAALLTPLIRAHEKFQSKTPECVLDPVSISLTSDIKIQTQRLKITKKTAMSDENFSLFLMKLWEALDQSGLLFNQSINLGSLPFPFESIAINYIPLMYQTKKLEDLTPKERQEREKRRTFFCVSPFTRLNVQAAGITSRDDDSTESSGSDPIEPTAYPLSFRLEDLENLKISWFKVHEQNQIKINQIQGIPGIPGILEQLKLYLLGILQPIPISTSELITSESSDELLEKMLEEIDWINDDEDSAAAREKYGFSYPYQALGSFTDVQRLERGLMDLSEFREWLELRLEIHKHPENFQNPEGKTLEENSYRLINGFKNFDDHDYLQVEEFESFLEEQGIVKEDFLLALAETHKIFSESESEFGAGAASGIGREEPETSPPLHQKRSEDQGVEERKDGSIDGSVEDASHVALPPTSFKADKMALLFCEHLLASSPPTQAASSTDSYLTFERIARAIDQEIERRSFALSDFTEEDFKALRTRSRKTLKALKSTHAGHEKTLKQTLSKIHQTRTESYTNTTFSKEEIERLSHFLIQIRRVDLHAKLPTLIENTLSWAKKLNTLRQNLIQANQEISRHLIQQAINHAKTYTGLTCSARKKAIFQYQLSFPLQRILNTANPWSEDSLEKAIDTVTTFLGSSEELSLRRFCQCLQGRFPTQSFQTAEKIASLFSLTINLPTATQVPALPGGDSSTPLLRTVLQQPDAAPLSTDL